MDQKILSVVGHSTVEIEPIVAQSVAFSISRQKFIEGNRFLRVILGDLGVPILLDSVKTKILTTLALCNP